MKEEFEVSVIHCEMWRWCRRIWRIFVKDKPSVFLQVAVNSWSFSTSCWLLAEIPSPPSFVLPWHSCLWRLDCTVLGKGLVSSPSLAVQRVTAGYINRIYLLHEWVWTCVSEDRRDKLKGSYDFVSPHLLTAKWNCYFRRKWISNWINEMVKRHYGCLDSCQYSFRITIFPSSVLIAYCTISLETRKCRVSSESVCAQ